MGFFDQRDYGNESLNFVAGLMRQYWGREPTEAEVRGFGDPGKKGYDTNFRNKITDAIRGSGDTAAYAKRQEEEAAAATAQQNAAAAGSQNQSQGGSQGSSQGGGSDRERIDAWLREVESTDDPNYWYKVVADKGGVDAVGADWLHDAIRRGDGSILVRNGQLSRRGAEGGGGDGTVFGQPVDQYIQPFTENFDYGDFKYDDFKAPTEADLKTDPGVQATINMANDALQHSAAAKGGLLSGATSQAISDQTSSLSQDAFKNLFGRKLTEYGTNRSNAYDEYNTNRAGAFDEYNTRRSNFYQNQDSPFAKLFGLQQLQQGNDQFNANLASQRYQFDRDLASRNQNSLNDLNLRYAGLGAGLIGNGSGAFNNYLTGGANASAAGTIGSGNAYSSLFGQLSQIPWLAAYLQQQRSA